MTDVPTPSTPAGFAPGRPNLLVLSPDLVGWIEHLRQLRADLKATKAREEEVATYLKAVLKGHAGGTYNGRLLVTTTPHAGREKVNTKLLQAKHPDVYAECVGRGDPFTTLTIK